MIAFNIDIAGYTSFTIFILAINFRVDPLT